jgi:hypothetical protein
VNILRNQIYVAKESLQCLLVDLVSDFRVLANLLQLWDITLCKNLVTEHRELLSIKRNQLNFVRVGFLILNMGLRLLEVCVAALDQPDVLLYLCLIS